MNPHHLLMIDLSGPILTPDERAFFADYKVGGICLFSRNVKDSLQTAELTSELRDLLGADLIIATDQEGGSVVRALDVPYSPGTMLLGSANDTELTHRVAAATARGLRSLGVNVNFAPVADVNNNPRNPVIGERSFGSGPSHVAQHVVAYVQGLQSEGVAATVKHFPGHGDTDTDSHLSLPTLDVSKERFEEVELAPFRSAFTAGAACVMSYHGRVVHLDTELPATLSRTVMTDLLRGELSFDGVSFTDALEMHAIPFNPTEAVVRSLIAGADMPLFDVHTGPIQTHEDILKGIDKALAEGRLEVQEVAAKLERLRRLAHDYPAQINPQTAWQAGDAALLAEAAQRGVALLGDLPHLTEELSIALVTAEDKIGGAASDVMTPPSQRLAELLASKGLNVNQVHYSRAHPDNQDEIKRDVSQHDVTLFASTSRTRMEPEEVGLGMMVAQHAKTFVHLALWNPYHVTDLPGPALISFGFREVSLEAVANVLAKEVGARGRSPIPLRTRNG